MEFKLYLDNPIKINSLIFQTFWEIFYSTGSGI